MIWEHIEGFSQNEKWGKPGSVNGLLLFLLTIVRKEFRKFFDPAASFVIHNAYDTSGHATDSQHYKGNAADFHIDTSISYKDQIAILLDIFKDLQVEDRVGFGIYPQWNNKGFHLDVRGTRARWGQIDGKYVSMSEALIKEDLKL